MTETQQAAMKLLLTLLDSADSKCQGLYKTLALVPFEIVREIVKAEESAIKQGKAPTADVTAVDIKLIKMKYDMFETIYNELHAFAKEMGKHKDQKAN